MGNPTDWFQIIAIIPVVKAIKVAILKIRFSSVKLLLWPEITVKIFSGLTEGILCLLKNEDSGLIV